MKVSLFLFVATFASAAAFTIPSYLDSSESCSGYCGSYSEDYSTGGRCYCDTYCTTNGDCCENYSEICLGTDNGSCDGYCGNYNPNGGCYCDGVCATNPFGDCCLDWEEFCAASLTPPPAARFCQSGDNNYCSQCNGDFSAEYCCCDGYCTIAGDCCPDYSENCEVQEGSCADNIQHDGGNACGDVSPSYTCYCDAFCTSNGDCCEDYSDVCVDASAGPSCEDYCGQGVPSPDGTYNQCYCDSYCTYAGDCCEDYSDTCIIVSLGCEGNCGTYGGSCWCDNACTYNFDCCEDFSSLCYDSCSGYCGSFTTPNPSCHCDAFCTAAGDCCSDYSLICVLAIEGTCGDDGSYCGGAGQDYQCMCDSYCTYFGDCCPDFSIACVSMEPPPNAIGDDVDNPIYIETIPFTDERDTDLYSDTLDASAGLCGASVGGHDVIYKFQPGSDISVRASVCNDERSFDTVLYVVQCIDGNCDNDINLDTVGVKCNDDGDQPGCGGGSVLAVSLKAGETYLFVVDGKDDTESGLYKLELTSFLGDTPQTAIIVDSLPYSYDGNILDYTDQYTPPSTCIGDSSAADVFFSFTPSYDVSVDINTCGSKYDTAVVVMEYDNGVLTQDDAVCNDDAHRQGCDIASAVVVELKADTTYIIVIDGYENGPSDITLGDFRLTISSVEGDTYDTAISISSLPYTVEGTTVGFTDDNSGKITADCVVNAKGNDVWYTYTPEEDVSVVISLCGSEFDTILFLLRSDGNGGVTQNNEQCNNDANRDGCGKGSELSAELVAGVQYYIVVDGVNGDSGNYRLEIDDLIGDDQSNPIIINSLPFLYEGSTLEYHDSYKTPNTCGFTQSGTKDVVFKYLSPIQQKVNVSLCGSDIDTYLTVIAPSNSPFSGGQPKLVDCNDAADREGCGDASELAEVQLKAYKTYFIVVDGKGDGDFRLSVETDLI